MKKLIAIVNVVAWSGFWAFGYLAFSADTSNGRQMVIAAALAALGAGLGLWAYFRLVRISETSGYAQAPRRGVPTYEQDEGESA
ncbi:hypothetical protein [Pseudooceanicola sp.]|uniref:hypothetical protein n=1 Tax=Pseudooceanicola sp. TaxID=1914328 RepID=UPI00260AE0EF|nr:hypothetical protein [Pseudooceanicola sp.]MDF1855702.1 hypothetical protein [Pseudooceanicola sp.]